MAEVVQGDYTELAKSYVNRPGYSRLLLKCLVSHMGGYRENFKVADVGAGTGKMTEILIELNLSGYSVEPNDAMRAEGVRLFGERRNFAWMKGSAEQTGLPDSSVDWVVMASSFHWTDTEAALKEFYRILRPGGFFTAIWNPRDLEAAPLQLHIERQIRTMIPDYKRVSSGSKEFTRDVEKKLMSTDLFSNVIFMEAPHVETMNRQRYMEVWRSVNDIQSQAGEKKWKEILGMIEREIGKAETIEVAYRSRAWTIQALPH